MEKKGPYEPEITIINAPVEELPTPVAPRVDEGTRGRRLSSMPPPSLSRPLGFMGVDTSSYPPAP
jgi:hypothetical protein